jgi:flagellar hook-associated protein 1 FlgK
MYSSFFGIEIAKKALFAQQRAQENVAHNIANANTPGYSRQRAIMESTYVKPYGGTNLAGTGAYQLGSGVKVEDIARVRDAFKDMQFREENSGLGFWQFQADSLKQIEAVFNEPSDIGVSSVLTEFWKSLEELSKNPEAVEIRETVKERAVTLTNTINHTANQLQQIINDVNFRLSIKVDEVNNLAKQISELNAQIQQTEIVGVTASDLRDKRDLLLDDLSKLVNIDTYEDQNGIFTVTVGGAIMIKGSDYETMKFDIDNPSDGVRWSGYNTDVNLSKGELKGLLELRDNKIKVYQDKLNSFTTAFVSNFNSIHKNGYDLDGNPGVDFFRQPPNAGEIISVSSDILNDIRKIAAAGSSTGVPGDNENALALANLKYDKVLIDGQNITLDDYYGALISKLGVDSQEAQRMAASQEVMVSQLDEQRKEISSVSLDEEMAKMVMYQHAYNAAARMVTTLDEMIDTIVNRMGITGR